MDIDAEGNEEEPEITLPREEYEALTRQAHEADELANKRVDAALAKVGPSLLITSEAQKPAQSSSVICPDSGWILYIP